MPFIYLGLPCRIYLGTLPEQGSTTAMQRSSTDGMRRVPANAPCASHHADHVWPLAQQAHVGAAAPLPQSHCPPRHGGMTTAGTD